MNRSNLKRLTRGAATVEMSIAVIILVPTIMYTIFLEDLLAYKLEAYESAASPAWDYLSLDFNGRAESDGVTTDPEAVPQGDVLGGANHYRSWDNGGFARLTYCDHTSTYNSYDQSAECDDNHHDGTVTAAHQCWMVPKAKQIGCRLEKDDYLASGSLKGLADFDGSFNKGGVYTCGAKLGVMNYFLPNQFWTWSKTRNEADEATEKAYSVFTKNRFKEGDDNRQGDKVHQNYNAAGVDGKQRGNLVLAPQEFAVLHDPWATNYPPETDGDRSYGRFHERMEVHYVAYDSQLSTAKAFGQAAIGQGVLGSGAIQDSPGDDPKTPTVAWKKEQTRTVHQHTASGWEDDRQQNSYGSRQQGYFGWAPDEG